MLAMVIINQHASEKIVEQFDAEARMTSKAGNGGMLKSELE